MAANQISARAARTWVVVALLALATAACGVASSTASPAVELPTDAAEILTGEFATIGGSTVALESIQGKDAVFWFWAPW